MQHRRWLAFFVAMIFVAVACGTRVTNGPVTAGGTATTANTVAALSVGEAGEVEEGATDDGQPGQAEGASGAGGGSGADGGGGAAGGANGAGAQGVGPASAQQCGGATDTGVSENEIRIGLDATLSGLLATLGAETEGGFNSFLRMLNEAGGINCRKFKVITYDNRFDANQSAQNIKRLVDQDKVFLTATFSGDESMDFVTGRGVPMIVFGVTPFGFSSQFPTVFPVVGNALLWQQDLVYLATKYFGWKPKRVAIIYDNVTWDMRPYLSGFKKTWEEVGAEVVSERAWTLTSGDCTELVLEWQRLDVDTVDLNTPGFTSCITAAEQQRWKPEQGWGGWPASTVLAFELMGRAAYWADGIVGGSLADRPDGRPGARDVQYAGTDVPPNFIGVYPQLKQYLDAIARYYPRLNNEARLESPAMLGWWVMAKLVADGIAACGTELTRKCFVEKVQSFQNWDSGVGAPIRSLRSTCKTGSEYVWAARWRYDREANRPYRQPETLWATSPWKDRLGGDCFLTKMSDEFVK